MRLSSRPRRLLACCRRRKRLPYHPLTLKFPAQDMEDAFASRNTDLLIWGLKLVFFAGFSTSVVIMAFSLLVQKAYARSSFPTDAAYQITRVSLCCLGVLMVLLAVCSAALHSKEVLLKRVKPATLEVICTGLLTVAMGIVVLRQPVQVARMMGHDFSGAFGDQHVSDSGVLMAILGMIAVVHTGVPMRWCTIVILEIAGTAYYCLMIFAIGSCEPMANSVYNATLLLAISLVLGMGKRATEINHRQAFLEIIRQKQLRCEAEYELERVASEKSDPDKAAVVEEVGADGSEQLPKSSTESNVTTSPSVKVFTRMLDEQNSTMPQRLTGVIELGNAEHWMISEEEVKLVPKEVLGTGSYGQVIKGIFCGLMVAVKLPHDRLERSSMRKLPALCNELRVLRRVRHPNIIAFHGAMVNSQHCQIALVMELSPGQPLNAFMEESDHNSLNTLKRFQLILGVCHALLYLHTRQPAIVHGDLKSSNVLVETDGDTIAPKLLDFGLSRVITRRTRPLGGSLAWMAPEVLKHEGPVKCSADVYSFGRMLALIATGIPPMPGKSRRQVKKALVQGRPPLPTWPEGNLFEPSIKLMVHACLRAGEGERPPMEQVHEKIVQLPEEMNFAEAHREELKDVRFVAQQMNRDLPPEFEQTALLSSLAETIHQEPTSLERLPSVPEDGQPSESSAALPPPPKPVLEEGSETESSADSESSERSESSQKAEGAVRLFPFACKKETRLQAMEESLLATVARWNYEAPKATCCERHTAMRLAKYVGGLVKARPCTHEPLQHSSVQCRRCGILGVVDVCDVCGAPTKKEAKVVASMAL